MPASSQFHFAIFCAELVKLCGSNITLLLRLSSCYFYEARSFGDREQIVLAILSIYPILAESIGRLALQLSIAELS
ncbi:hypothetical protein [Chamaesiphon minutus]|uniref:hypothetical protein n=1 Tax=Chamaesiphon minutus TaxID=1173032 RepID=UPI0002E9073B|nr:hypothetical protein [Chamaesiphon minutus]